MGFEFGQCRGFLLFSIWQRARSTGRPAKSTEVRKGILLMNEEALARQITALRTRVNQLESMMQQLLTILTTSGATSTGEQIQMQNMLRELQDATGFSSQDRPEMAAIREALLAGDKIKAIKLYRGVYGVGLKEAKDAIDVM